MNKKSQIWGIDLIAALTIMIIVIGVFYLYAVNILNENDENIKRLKIDGEIIMEIILSEGYPQNWTKENVVNIGLLSNSKINQTKLEFFNSLCQENYEKTKKLFKTKYDYFLFFDEKIVVEGVEIDGIGKPGVNINNINSKNLIKISRICIYDDKPKMVYLYIWEE